LTGLRFDLTTIGNAIVDVLARAEDDLLQRLSIQKGGMTLVDEPRAEELYNAMGQTVEISGGSAANTAVAAAQLGLKTHFFGKVKADGLGKTFTHDIRATGVSYDTPLANDGAGTARCMIFVTPDGERSMNTFLGAAQFLTPSDIDEEVIAASAIIYMEGYLWDPPAAKEAFVKAAGIAHKAGRRVALSLSDSFCVDRYRDEFLKLMRDGTVDIVFANLAELKSLYETADVATALDALRADVGLGVVTMSEEGAVAVTADELVRADAYPVERVVDTTGAGDLFAAGFLAGYCRSFSLEACLRLGALSAAEVISHMGARPEANLKALAAENGFSGL
jgi:sugar/nucleoside kinase (ribokinase family)